MPMKPLPPDEWVVPMAVVCILCLLVYACRG